jgi:hypothetical protein
VYEELQSNGRARKSAEIDLQQYCVPIFATCLNPISANGPPSHAQPLRQLQRFCWVKLAEGLQACGRARKSAETTCPTTSSCTARRRAILNRPNLKSWPSHTPTAAQAAWSAFAEGLQSVWKDQAKLYAGWPGGGGGMPMAHTAGLDKPNFKSWPSHTPTAAWAA